MSARAGGAGRGAMPGVSVPGADLTHVFRLARRKLGCDVAPDAQSLVLANDCHLCFLAVSSELVSQRTLSQ